MQDGPDLPAHVGRAIYTIYAYLFGQDQSYERIVERGGFGYEEAAYMCGKLKERRLREIERDRE